MTNTRVAALALSLGGILGGCQSGDPESVEGEDASLDPAISEAPYGQACSPSVWSVSPLRAPLGVRVHFMIQGACLPSALAFFLANCRDRQVEVDDSGDWAVASCLTQEGGEQAGVVKDRARGRVLEEFTVVVEDTD